MNSARIELPADVEAFIDEVVDRSVNCDVYIAGGYIRDLYLGLEPKDIDVFVVPHEGQTANPWQPAKGYCNYHKLEHEIPDMEARGVHSVKGMWYKGLTTTDVQFIQYKRHMDAEQLAADMDMNICQVVWDPATGELTLTEAFMNGHRDKVIECLHDYDVLRKHLRYERMKKKFPDYNTEGEPVLANEELDYLKHQAQHPGSFIELVVANG